MCRAGWSKTAGTVREAQCAVRTVGYALLVGQGLGRQREAWRDTAELEARTWASRISLNGCAP